MAVTGARSEDDCASLIFVKVISNVNIEGGNLGEIELFLLSEFS